MTASRSRAKRSPRLSDGRGSRWEAHRAARRKELIAAVVAVVRADGAAVSMDDIAVASGVAKPVYYRYFADKADLHLAVGRAVARSVVRQITEAMDREHSARAKLAASIDVYLRLIEADPEVYRFVVHSAPPSRDARRDPVEDFASIVGLHATQVVGDLLRQAGADAAAAEPWGFGLVGMVRAAADRWLEHPSMSREAMVDYLADLVVPGLAAAASEEPEGARRAPALHLLAESRRQAPSS